VKESCRLRADGTAAATHGASDGQRRDGCCFWRDGL